jgi:hypothetical protein
MRNPIQKERCPGAWAADIHRGPLPNYVYRCDVPPSGFFAVRAKLELCSYLNDERRFLHPLYRKRRNS